MPPVAPRLGAVKMACPLNGLRRQSTPPAAPGHADEAGCTLGRAGLRHACVDTRERGCLRHAVSIFAEKASPTRAVAAPGRLRGPTRSALRTPPGRAPRLPQGRRRSTRGATQGGAQAALGRASGHGGLARVRDQPGGPAGGKSSLHEFEHDEVPEARWQERPRRGDGGRRRGCAGGGAGTSRLAPRLTAGAPLCVGPGDMPAWRDGRRILAAGGGPYCVG